MPNLGLGWKAAGASLYEPENFTSTSPLRGGGSPGPLRSRKTTSNRRVRSSQKHLQQAAAVGQLTSSERRDGPPALAPRSRAAAAALPCVGGRSAALGSRAVNGKSSGVCPRRAEQAALPKSGGRAPLPSLSSGQMLVSVGPGLLGASRRELSRGDALVRSVLLGSGG